MFYFLPLANDSSPFFDCVVTSVSSSSPNTEPPFESPKMYAATSPPGPTRELIIAISPSETFPIARLFRDSPSSCGRFQRVASFSCSPDRLQECMTSLYLSSYLLLCPLQARSELRAEPVPHALGSLDRPSLKANPTVLRDRRVRGFSVSTFCRSMPSPFAGWDLFEGLGQALLIVTLLYVEGRYSRISLLASVPSLQGGRPLSRPGAPGRCRESPDRRRLRTKSFS